MSERKERGGRSVDRKGGVWIGKREYEWGSERGKEHGMGRRVNDGGRMGTITIEKKR